VTSYEALARPDFSRDERYDTASPPVFLIPVNYSRSSKAALHLAMLLAVPSKAKLVIVRVVPTPRRNMAASRPSEDAAPVDQETERLQTFVAKLFAHAPAKTDHELIVAVDRVTDRKIAELAAAHDATLIIMGASGDGMRRRLFGGVVERIRCRVACPVVTIGARAPRGSEGSGRSQSSLASN
jgi:nucleotide-binding universal stress UspA family protein